MDGSCASERETDFLGFRARERRRGGDGFSFFTTERVGGGRVVGPLLPSKRWEKRKRERERERER